MMTLRCQTQVAQPPPSPPVEKIPKCSLPSISNLLRNADKDPSQQQEQARQRSQQTPDDRRHPLQYAPSRTATAPRQSLPLTPSKRPDSGSESRHFTSSSVCSATQYGCVPTHSAYYSAAVSAISNLDVNLERQSTESPRASVFLCHPQYGLPTSYTMTPAPRTMNNNDSTLAGNPHISNRMYCQWPLLRYTPASTNLSHHHFIVPSTCLPLPQNQYICPTCSKMFARPSSLGIHSRSHTGEKPFRCPVRGCGKQFSVKSNMKRHERRWHGAGGC